jgi:Fic family protein
VVLQKDLRQKILNESGASIRSIQLLDALFLSPLFTINDIAESLQISYQAAKDQVSFFLNLGILEELTGQKRSKRFAFKPYLDIIEQ